MTGPDLFIEFARLKLAADGSDSYILGAVERALEVDDPYFYLGVFTTFYAPPSQDVFYAKWGRADMYWHPEKVEAWVTENWKNLPLSGARRTGAFTPAKIVKALAGYAVFLDAQGLHKLPTTFPEAFAEFVKHVPYHGRYTGLKLYEALRRVGAPLPEVTDIVPKGGRTPRKGLDMIWGHDYKRDDTFTLHEANDMARQLKDAVPTTWFNVEMLLCNFSKAVKGSYYPGHALDRELSRGLKVQSIFGEEATADLWRVRQELFSHLVLGEHQGWHDRKPLEKCYPDHGYLWSDFRYCYNTTTDLSQPDKFGGLVVVPPPLKGHGEE